MLLFFLSECFLAICFVTLLPDNLIFVNTYAKLPLDAAGEWGTGVTKYKLKCVSKETFRF